MTGDLDSMSPPQWMIDDMHALLRGETPDVEPQGLSELAAAAYLNFRQLVIDHQIPGITGVTGELALTGEQAEQRLAIAAFRAAANGGNPDPRELN